MGNLLLITILLPLAGAMLCHGSRRRIQWIALVATTVTLLAAGFLVFSFPQAASHLGQVEPSTSQLPSHTTLHAHGDLCLAGRQPTPVDLRLNLGLDGLSLWFFASAALLCWTAVLISWETVSHQPARYYRCLLALTSGMLGLFAARDIILFFVFFEFTIIPAFLLIGVWGHRNRRRAANTFFLFNLSSGLIAMLGLLAIVVWDFHHGPTGRLTFAIDQLTEHLASMPMPADIQLWVFGALLIGFAARAALLPLHAWLPSVLVESPTAACVLLCGTWLGLGAYGFARFCMPLLTEASALAAPWLLGISSVGILYGGLLAVMQQSLKRLLAYWTISQMGICMLGLFTLDQQGMTGGILQIINQALAIGGLFALVGMIGNRYSIRSVDDLNGLVRRLPRAAFFMLLLGLASIGLPGLGGFVAKYFVLLDIFRQAWTESAAGAQWSMRVIFTLAALGIVLGTWALLRPLERIFFYSSSKPAIKEKTPSFTTSASNDLCRREMTALAPSIVLIVWIGLWPSFFSAAIRPAVAEQAMTPQTTLEKDHGN